MAVSLVIVIQRAVVTSVVRDVPLHDYPKTTARRLNYQRPFGANPRSDEGLMALGALGAHECGEGDTKDVFNSSAHFSERAPDPFRNLMNGEIGDGNCRHESQV